MCLTDVVHEGWKSENGFKAGFQRELEKGMRKILPGTEIIVNPYINSKIHVWKKEYGVLSDLLSKSGIGWNSTTSMIEVEDEGVWDIYIWADQRVKGLRYKTWSYYLQWIYNFGKDRATGENVVDHIDLANELYRNGMDQEWETREKYVPLTPYGMQDIKDNNKKPIDSKLKTMSKGKKIKCCDPNMTMLVDSLEEFMKNSKNAMTDLSAGVEKGTVSSNENKQLNDIMKGIIGLKVSDKLKVCNELVQNTERLNFFMSLPAEEQEEYVWMLLDDRL
ncbi:hypothetical protein ACS0TY_022440 [Phlomoides rotata]